MYMTFYVFVDIGIYKLKTPTINKNKNLQIAEPERGSVITNCIISHTNTKMYIDNTQPWTNRL